MIEINVNRRKFLLSIASIISISGIIFNSKSTTLGSYLDPKPNMDELVKSASSSMAGLPPPLPKLPPITIYVAPQSGDDHSDGRTPDTAWRHPPGDENASGNAALYVPVPGDHIAFKGGERWYGRIARPSAGVAANPIVWSGNAWGTGRAIIDGASADNLIDDRLPTSPADAGGHSYWNNGELRVVEWGWDDDRTVIFDSLGNLTRSQYPRAKNKYQFDNTIDDSGAYLDLPDGIKNSIEKKEINNSSLSALLEGDGGYHRLWLNRIPSLYSWIGIAGIRGMKVQLNEWRNAGIELYSDNMDKNDRVRPFLWDRVADVEKPGDWCLLGPRKALVWTRERGGALRRAIGLNADGKPEPYKSIGHRDHNHIRGFEITGHTEGFIANNRRAGSGLFARFSGNEPVTGWHFQDNYVHDCFFGGAAVSAVHMGSTIEPVISHNRFFGLAGMAAAIGGTGENATVAWNTIDTMSHEGLRLMSDQKVGAHIHHNIVTNVAGVHANGVAIYQGSEGVVFEFNAVLNSVRPLAVQLGGRYKQFKSRIIRNCVFEAVKGQKSGNPGIRLDGNMENIDIRNVIILTYDGQNGISVKYPGKNNIIDDVLFIKFQRNNIDSIYRYNFYKDKLNFIEEKYDKEIYYSKIYNIYEKDYVNFSLPDGTLNIDLRGVAV